MDWWTVKILLPVGRNNQGANTQETFFTFSGAANKKSRCDRTARILPCPEFHYHSGRKRYIINSEKYLTCSQHVFFTFNNLLEFQPCICYMLEGSQLFHRGPEEEGINGSSANFHKASVCHVQCVHSNMRCDRSHCARPMWLKRPEESASGSLIRTP